MTSSPTLLLRVAAAWPVPGLGLLLLPDAQASTVLHIYPLHTALRIVAHRPDGAPWQATATVEEVAHGDARQYGLLVTIDEADAAPAGTEVWLAE